MPRGYEWWYHEALEALRSSSLHKGKTVYFPPLLEPAAPQQAPAAQSTTPETLDPVVETVSPEAQQAPGTQKGASRGQQPQDEAERARKRLAAKPGKDPAPGANPGKGTAPGSTPVVATAIPTTAQLAAAVEAIQRVENSKLVEVVGSSEVPREMCESVNCFGGIRCGRHCRLFVYCVYPVSPALRLLDITH